MLPFLRPLLLLSFLFFLGSGLVVTLFHRSPPSQPFATISLLSYATMAPFQTYEKLNAELLAESLRPHDLWTPLPLGPSLPLPPGERVVWTTLGSFARKRSSPPEDPALLPGYKRMAERLLFQEQRRGNPASAIRLFWETWPASPAGYLAWRSPPFLQRTLLVQVP